MTSEAEPGVVDGRVEVQAVVLNWRAPEATLRCVESLRGSLGASVDVLVVENGSGDGSADRLRRRLGTERVLAMGENSGYAGGMNAGARHWLEARESAEFLLLVTQDVVFDPHALARLLRAARTDERIGAVGPSVHYLHEPDRLMNRGFRLDPRTARVLPAASASASPADGVLDVDSVDGCCLLLRRESFEAVGGLDERYFLYFEETDLCQRIRDAGWRVAVVPEAKVLQEKEGVPGPHYFYYMSRNRYLFWRRHGGTSHWRIAGSLLTETLRMGGAWARALVVASRRREAAGHRVRLLRQLRGSVTGTLDYARGRFGPMP